jgi:hypothetical protein
MPNRVDNGTARRLSQEGAVAQLGGQRQAAVRGAMRMYGRSLGLPTLVRESSDCSPWCSPVANFSRGGEFRSLRSLLSRCRRAAWRRGWQGLRLEPRGSGWQLTILSSCRRAAGVVRLEPRGQRAAARRGGAFRTRREVARGR